MFSDGHQQSVLMMLVVNSETIITTSMGTLMMTMMMMMMLVVNSFITTSVGTFSKESSPGVDAARLKCLSDSRYDQVVLCCTVSCSVVF